MLKALGCPLPKQMLAHGWWQKDGQKMSKSRATSLTPSPSSTNGASMPFAFTSLRELDIGPDGNWTDAGFQVPLPAELANGLGNLVNRSLSMLKRYRNGVVPARLERTCARRRKKRSPRRSSLLEQNELQAALLDDLVLVTRANQYVDQTAPFKLAKDPQPSARLDEVLYSLRRDLPDPGGACFRPFCPRPLRASILSSVCQALRISLADAHWGPQPRPHHRRTLRPISAQRPGGR